MKTKNIIIMVLVILLLIILFQNLSPIPIQIFFWTLNVSLLLALLVSFLIGLVVGILYSTNLSRHRTNQKSAGN
jgi:uncharacterized integral membrane protein